MRGLWLVAFAVSIACSSSSTNDEPTGGNDASTGGSAGASGSGGGAGVGNGGAPATAGTAGTGVAGSGIGGGLAGSVGDSGATCPTSGVVINEVSTRNGTFTNDEFIELYNASLFEIPLNGWKLRYAGPTGTPTIKVWTGPAGAVIPATGFALITGSQFSGTDMGMFLDQAIGDDGGIALFDGGDTKLDAVGYGQISAHPYKEGTEVGKATSAGYGIGRLPDGDDCNNNSDDFQINLAHSPGLPNL